MYEENFVEQKKKIEIMKQNVERETKHIIKNHIDMFVKLIIRTL